MCLSESFLAEKEAKIVHEFSQEFVVERKPMRH